MAAALAKDLLKGAAEKLASWVFEKYSAALIGDQPYDIEQGFKSVNEAINKSADRVINELRELIKDGDYQKRTGRIFTMVEKLEEVTILKKHGNSKDFDEFRDDLRRNSAFNGISDVMNELHEILVGNNLSKVDNTFIHSVVTGMHEALQSEDHAAGIEWYLKRIHDYLTHAAYYQLKGLMLITFMYSRDAGDAQLAAGWRDRVMDRIKQQIEFAYSCMHPFVKQLKKSFFAPIDSRHWWRLEASDRRVLQVGGYAGAGERAAANIPLGDDRNKWRWRINFNGKDDGVTITCGTEPYANMNLQGVLVKSSFTDDVKLYQEVGTFTSRWTEWRDGRVYEIVEQTDLKIKIMPLPNAAKFRMIVDKAWARETWYWLWNTEFWLTDDNIPQDPPKPYQPDHFYTINPDGGGAVEAKYQFEYVSGYVYPSAGDNRVALRRYYNREKRDHFYTTDADGENCVADGFTDEGIECYLPTTNTPETVSFWRKFNQTPIFDHLYTTDGSEGNPEYVVQRMVGIIFGSQVAGTVPLFRWYAEHE